jgi:hypothetical protein
VHRLDDATLAALAQLICGDGESPYRSAREIQGFFRRAGVDAAGGGASRADWALQRLEECNAEWAGRLVPHALEQVILRLAQPCEYRGSREAYRATLDRLNDVLAGEGLRVVMAGREPVLDELSLDEHGPAGDSSAPNFAAWTGDAVLARLLQERWAEAHACLEAGACVAATLMLGSILEGVLCSVVRRHAAAVAGCPRSPRDGAGRIRPLREWTAQDLVEVACACGWLRRETARFAHQLTDYRALLHPYHQWQRGEHPDAGTCRAGRQVLMAILQELPRDVLSPAAPSPPSARD